MTKPIRAKSEEAIQKMLENLKIYKFNTVSVLICAYEISIFTLYHYYKKHHDHVTAHVYYQLLTYVKEKIVIK